MYSIFIRYIFLKFLTVFQRKKYFNGYLSIQIPAKRKSGPLKLKKGGKVSVSAWLGNFQNLKKVIRNPVTSSPGLPDHDKFYTLARSSITRLQLFESL